MNAVGNAAAVVAYLAFATSLGVAVALVVQAVSPDRRAGLVATHERLIVLGIGFAVVSQIGVPTFPMVLFALLSVGGLAATRREPAPVERAPAPAAPAEPVRTTLWSRL